MGLLRQLETALGRGARARLGRLAVVQIVAASSEAVGLGLVLPLVVALSQGSRAASLAGLLAGAFALRTGLVVAAQRALLRLLEREQRELAERLHARLLTALGTRRVAFEPAMALRIVTMDVQSVVTQVIVPGFALVADTSLLLAALTVTLIVAPTLAPWLMAVGAIAWGVQLAAQRGPRRNAGERAQAAGRELSRRAHQSFGGSEAIVLAGREAVFAERFATAQAALGAELRAYRWAAVWPRAALEVAVVIAAMGVTLIAPPHTWSGSRAELALFVVILIRATPAASRVGAAVAALRFGAPALRQVVEVLQLPTAQPGDAKPTPDWQVLRLEGVEHTPPGSSAPLLEAIDLEVRAGARLGVVGHTGVGKTSLVELLLGLRRVNAGRVLLDDVPFDPCVPAWHAAVGYVPQQLSLLDDDLLGNVTLGLPPDRVDAAALAAALRVSGLDELVSSAPAGLATRVGDGGLRLSGGELQRVGIARALYGRPALLVLDEATSGLDVAAEAELFAALDRERPELALVVVTHRASTLAHLREVLVVARGGLRGPAAPERLAADSPELAAVLGGVGR